MLICAALPMAADARPRVVVDADMSFDDAATLAYLAQADRHGFIDLDAVTVSLSGAGYTGRGLSHARCLLRKHGLPGVPVSDGDALGANPLPEAIRSYVDRVVHDAAALGDSAGCPDVPTEGRAARILTAPRGRFTLIALGPLTNVAQALARDPSLARRIERVFIMGAGTTHGNLCCGAGDGTDHGQEFNFWADPAAAQKVFSALSGKIHLTALNATDFVPITFDFADRLACGQHDRGHRDGRHDPLGPRRAGVHAPGPHVLVGPAQRGRGDHRPSRDLRAHQAHRRAERGGGRPNGRRPAGRPDPPGRRGRRPGVREPLPGHAEGRRAPERQLLTYRP